MGSPQHQRENGGSHSQEFDFDSQTVLYNGNEHPREYYLKGIEKPVQRHRYARYADKTKLRLLEVEEEWQQYVTQRASIGRLMLTAIPCIFCRTVLCCENNEGFKSASPSTIEKFLEWTLCQKKGKNGRKKRGTTKRSSLHTKWKYLQIVYKVIMGRAFEPRIYDEMTVVGGAMQKIEKLC